MCSILWDVRAYTHTRICVIVLRGKGRIKKLLPAAEHSVLRLQHQLRAVQMQQQKPQTGK
jgi:hypothetical protein